MHFRNRGRVRQNAVGYRKARNAGTIDRQRIQCVQRGTRIASEEPVAVVAVVIEARAALVIILG